MEKYPTHSRSLNCCDGRHINSSNSNNSREKKQKNSHTWVPYPSFHIWDSCCPYKGIIEYYIALPHSMGNYMGFSMENWHLNSLNNNDHTLPAQSFHINNKSRWTKLHTHTRIDIINPIRVIMCCLLFCCVCVCLGVCAPYILLHLHIFAHNPNRLLLLMFAIQLINTRHSCSKLQSH